MIEKNPDEAQNSKKTEEAAAQAMQSCARVMATTVIKSIQNDEEGRAVRTIVRGMRMSFPPGGGNEAPAKNPPTAKARRPEAEELHTIGSQLEDVDAQTEAYIYLTVIIRGMALAGMPTEGDEENTLRKSATGVSEWKPLKAGRQAGTLEATNRHERLDTLLTTRYITGPLLSDLTHPTSGLAPTMLSLQDAGQGHLAAAKTIMEIILDYEPNNSADILRPLAELMREEIRTSPTPAEHSRTQRPRSGVDDLAFQLFRALASGQDHHNETTPQTPEEITDAEHLVADTLWGLGAAQLLLGGCDPGHVASTLQRLGATTSLKPGGHDPGGQTQKSLGEQTLPKPPYNTELNSPREPLSLPVIKSEPKGAQDGERDLAGTQAGQPGKETATPPAAEQPQTTVKDEEEAMEIVPRAPSPGATSPHEPGSTPNADEHSVGGGQPTGPAITGWGELRPLQRGLVNMGGMDSGGATKLTPITLIKQNPNTQFWHVVMHAARDLRLTSLDPGGITSDEPNSHTVRTGRGDMGGYRIPIILLRHDAARDEWITVAHTADYPSMMTFKSADIIEDRRPMHGHSHEEAQDLPRPQGPRSHPRDDEGASSDHHPQHPYESEHTGVSSRDPRPAPHLGSGSEYRCGDEVDGWPPRYDLPAPDRDRHASQRGHEDPAARMRTPPPSHTMYPLDWHHHGDKGAHHIRGARAYEDPEGGRHSQEDRYYQQIDRRSESRSPPPTWSPGPHEGRGGGEDTTHSRSRSSPQHLQKRPHSQPRGLGKLLLGRYHDRQHAATTRTEGLNTAGWDKLKVGIKEVKPAAGTLLEDHGGLEQFIMDMATKVHRDKLSSSTPAIIMAIIWALDEHSKSDDFTLSQKGIIYAASLKAAQATNLDIMKYEWTDSGTSSMEEPERVEDYTVEQLATLLEESRGGSKFASNNSAVMRFAQAVKWTPGIPSEEALLKLLQDTHTWLRRNPRFINDRQVGERFGEKVSTSLESELTVAKNEGSGQWERHLNTYYHTMKSPTHRDDDMIDWVKDITDAAMRFATLSTHDQYQHRDRRGVPRRNIISGGVGDQKDETETTKRTEEALGTQMKSAAKYAQINSVWAPQAEGGPVCGFCNKNHDKSACFLWLDDSPEHRIFLYFRVIRTDRRFLEQVCLHGISRATVRGCNPPLGAIIRGSQGKGPLASSPRDGDRSNTLRWTEGHVQAVEDYMAKPEWRDIPKCNGGCCVRTQMGGEWEWADARNKGRPDRCTAITELNSRLNQQAIVATGASKGGPLRNADSMNVYALCNMTTTGDTQMVLESFCMARDERDAPIRAEETVDHGAAGRAPLSQ